MKKTQLILSLILFANVLLHAQDLKIDFPKGTIFLEGFANLAIEGYDGNQVIISESARENYFPVQTKGLTKINNRSSKESSTLKYEIRGKTLHITEPSSFGSYILKVPKSVNLTCKARHIKDYGYGTNKTYTINNVLGEIEIYVMEMINIELTNMSGQASIVTHGNIKATIQSFPKEGAISFDTYRGFVDVSMPKNINTGVTLTAKEGDIYSNFTVKKKGSKKNPETFLGTIGKGGNSLIIHTELGGNIYLRKR